MIKHLIFYWYVKPDGWCDVYDLHLKNCLFYKDIFDKVTLVLSVDDDTDAELINTTKDMFLRVFPLAEVINFKNNKEQRESAFFCSDVMGKLKEYNNNEACFFAHNKGFYSFYREKDDLFDWINCMYFCNLYNKTMIDSLLKNEDTITVGSCNVKNCKPKHFAACKYGWHYQGTFFWFIPSRLSKYLEEHNEKEPPLGRYYTEMLFGALFPCESKHNIKLYGFKDTGDKYKDYIQRNFPEETKRDFFDTGLKIKEIELPQ